MDLTILPLSLVFVAALVSKPVSLAIQPLKRGHRPLPTDTKQLLCLLRTKDSRVISYQADIMTVTVRVDGRETAVRLLASPYQDPQPGHRIRFVELRSNGSQLIAQRLKP